MSDRPILFSAPMIRALLEGRKTQTRRVLKPQPGGDGIFATLKDAKRALRWAPGDRLWVRENFKRVPASAFARSGVPQTRNPSDPSEAAIYAAGWDRSIPTWKPSIHMPRWASRLTLIVESVKVERLHHIDDDDAKAEGILVGEPIPEIPSSKGDIFCGGVGDLGNPFNWSRSPVCAYASLWTAINGGDSWDANPWVAALTFRVIKANIDSAGAAI